MLTKQLEAYINNNDTDKVLLFKEEYNHLTEPSNNVEIEDGIERFTEIYLELVNKESDETVDSDLSHSFLNNQMNYLEKHIDNYLYMEATAFEIISAESFTIEVDSVFNAYELILGLQLPKKKEKDIRHFIETNMKDSTATYQLMFDGKDGLWELNLPLEQINGFNKDMTIAEGIKLAYLFLFQLGVSLER